LHQTPSPENRPCRQRPAKPILNRGESLTRLSQRVRSIPRRVWSALGPGVITGAADDDPSGIATYSVAGAQLGTGLLWTALPTWPMMAAVQSMCARIGMVTGRGLTSTFRTKFPRSVLIGVAGLLMIANTINIGADLT